MSLSTDRLHFEIFDHANGQYGVTGADALTC
jgi:hypothetical protein